MSRRARTRVCGWPAGGSSRSSTPTIAGLPTTSPSSPTSSPSSRGSCWCPRVPSFQVGGRQNLGRTIFDAPLRPPSWRTWLVVRVVSRFAAHRSSRKAGLTVALASDGGQRAVARLAMHGPFATLHRRTIVRQATRGSLVERARGDGSYLPRAGAGRGKRGRDREQIDSDRPSGLDHLRKGEPPMSRRSVRLRRMTRRPLALSSRLPAPVAGSLESTTPCRSAPFVSRRGELRVPGPADQRGVDLA